MTATNLRRTLAWLALCLASVAVATLLTSFARLYADETMYVFFVAAVAVVTWRCGWQLGLVTIALSVLAVDFFFILPAGRLRPLGPTAIVRLLSFTLVSLAMIGVTRELRVARKRADASAKAAIAARELAERVSGERASFLSTLSHEVRTPINAILGYVDLLDAGTAGALTGEQLQLLRRVSLAGHHLLRVVNDVLEVAKAEAGHVEVQRQRLVLNTIVDEAITLTAPQAIAKHLTVTVKRDDEALLCVGDRDRIEQILINLLGNAVKFTPPNGNVTVASGKATNEKTVWLSVSDTGPGVSAEDQARIFEPFEKGKARRQGNAEGAGLGLAISRQLARLQGGTLTVASEPGQGACFTLTLPTARGGAGAPLGAPE